MQMCCLKANFAAYTLFTTLNFVQLRVTKNTQSQEILRRSNSPTGTRHHTISNKRKQIVCPWVYTFNFSDTRGMVWQSRGKHMKLIFSETSLIKFKKIKLNWHLIGTLLSHSLTQTHTSRNQRNFFSVFLKSVLPLRTARSEVSSAATGDQVQLLMLCLWSRTGQKSDLIL